jgi:hypothetical protein
MEIPENIKHLPSRSRDIPEYGQMDVLRYIVRIDMDSKRQTHGWQVRFKRPYVFLSDSKYGGILKTYIEAMSYLASVYHFRYLKRPTLENRNKAIPIGIRGVRLVKRKKKNRTHEELYAEVCPIKYGDSPKMIYIGTENTITAERKEAAVLKARRLRKQLESTRPSVKY